MNEIANLLTILYVTGIHQHLNTTLSLSVLVSLYLCVASTIVIALGLTMRSHGGILMLISDFMSQPFRTQHKSNRQASNAEELRDPLVWRHLSCEAASKAVREHHAGCLKFFNTLLDTGICREQARGVLPQNMYTEYYGTVNLNNLLKFIDLRTHEGAQWEIQKAAEACLEIATDLWPVTVSAYRQVRGLV